MEEVIQPPKIHISIYEFMGKYYLNSHEITASEYEEQMRCYEKNRDSQ